jgi:hypothetical protein
MAASSFSTRANVFVFSAGAGRLAAHRQPQTDAAGRHLGAEAFQLDVTASQYDLPFPA